MVRPVPQVIVTGKFCGSWKSRRKLRCSGGECYTSSCQRNKFYTSAILRGFQIVIHVVLQRKGLEVLHHQLGSRSVNWLARGTGKLLANMTVDRGCLNHQNQGGDAGWTPATMILREWRASTLDSEHQGRQQVVWMGVVRFRPRQQEDKVLCSRLWLL
jgi:hypothetical protein